MFPAWGPRVAPTVGRPLLSRPTVCLQPFPPFSQVNNPQYVGRAADRCVTLERGGSAGDRLVLLVLLLLLLVASSGQRFPQFFQFLFFLD